MPGVTAHGGAFTFSTTTGDSLSAAITNISVETPQAEVVDMTPYDAAADTIQLVPTGMWTGGSISVDYIHQAGGFDPQTVVRRNGSLSFSSSGYSVTRNAILESATTQAGVNDVVRGTLKFRLTDYTGS